MTASTDDHRLTRFSFETSPAAETTRHGQPEGGFQAARCMKSYAERSIFSKGI